MSESSVELYMGKSYAVFQHEANKEKELLELIEYIRNPNVIPPELTIKLLDLNKPDQSHTLATELLAESGTEDVFELADLIQDARKGANIDYMIEATLPGGTHEETGEYLRELMNDLYNKSVFNPDSFFEIIGKNDPGEFVFISD